MNKVDAINNMNRLRAVLYKALTILEGRRSEYAPDELGVDEITEELDRRIAEACLLACREACFNFIKATKIGESND